MFQERFKKMGKRIKTIVLGCLLAVLGMLAAVTVKADGSGSISLVFGNYTAGLKMTIYQVGEVHADGVVCTGDFADCGVTVPLLTSAHAEELEEAAEQLESYAQEKGIQGTEVQVDSNGKITFTGLDEAVYLIVQSAGEKEMQVQKILVGLPYLDPDYDDGTTSNDASLDDEVLKPKYTMSDGAILLTKKDDAGYALSGAVFKLQKKVEISDEDAATSQEEILTASDGTKYYWQDVDGQTGLTTNAKGQIAVQNLTYGTYRFVETQTPAGIVSTTVISDEIEVTTGGAISETDSTYEVASGTVCTVEVVNYRTSIEVYKVDGNNNGVSGAVLQVLNASGSVVEVQDVSGNLLTSWATDGSPKVLYGLTAGTYYLHEVTVPSGYLQAIDTEFTVTGTDSSHVVVKMTDRVIPSDPATITVQKTMTLNDEVIGATSQTFYVALFEDSACTVRISEVKELTFTNSTSASVVFDNLEKGVTYYVAEVDSSGNPISSGTVADGSTYVPYYASGQAVTTTGTDSLAIENVFTDLPDGFFKQATITVTKKVLAADGTEKASNETFYVGVFDDADYTTLSSKVTSNIVALEMNGKSSTSVSIPVAFNEGESFTLYLTEVNASGTPVTDLDSFAYELTEENTDVTISDNNLSAAVVLTNQAEAEATATPTPTTAPTSSSTTVQTAEVTPTTAAAQSYVSEDGKVQTGDDTPIGLYVGILIAAIAVIAVVVVKRRRNKN